MSETRHTVTATLRQECLDLAVSRYRDGDCEAAVENAVDVYLVAHGWTSSRREALIREIVPLAVVEVDGCTDNTP